MFLWHYQSSIVTLTHGKTEPHKALYHNQKDKHNVWTKSFRSQAGRFNFLWAAFGGLLPSVSSLYAKLSYLPPGSGFIITIATWWWYQSSHQTQLSIFLTYFGTPPLSQFCLNTISQMDTTDFPFQCGQEISHYTSLHQDAILLKGCGDPWLGRVNMHSTRPRASREALGSSDPTDLISLLQRVREGQDISNPFQLTGKSTCRSDRDPLPSSAAAQLKKEGPWCVCVCVFL